MAKPTQPLPKFEEIEVSRALMQLSINLAMQLALADGGNLVTVRAVAARIIEHNKTSPAARQIANSIQSVLNQTLTGLEANGVKISR